MANVKISNLPAATSPVASTDVIPVVQGGVTKKAAINQLGFLQAGTGAVTRTAQAKMRDTVSVKDFGVVGDGSDETTKMQSAFAAVTAGVRLSLSGLTVTINDALSVTDKSNFIIDGEGGTIIAKNGMAVSSGKGLLYLTNCEKFKVENITFDANRANRTPAEVAAHTVTITRCRKFIFENVYSNNAVVDGFYFAASDNTDPATYCLDFQMIGCFANNCYRQGASVINAYDFQFIGGAYTNTNGTAPQAGIDVESNTGATLGNARGLFQGVRFEGNAGSGIQLSNVGGSQEFVVDSCYFSANGAGGVLNYADLVNVRSCTFKNHSAAPGGGVGGILTFANAIAIRGGSAVGNIFTSNTAAIPCIYAGGSPQNISIRDNIILDHANAGGISSVGSNNVINGNTIRSCGGIGINVATGSDVVVENNKVNAATGRGIFNSATRTKIVNNVITNTASVSGGYIQAAGTDPLVVGNVCSSDSSVSDIGIRVDGNALAVYSNACINLNSTDPYSFITSANDETVFNNIGGTANDRRRVRFGMAVPSYTTAARPAASAVAAGQTIFNTTTNKLNTSDGSTNWYNADGTTA